VFSISCEKLWSVTVIGLPEGAAAAAVSVAPHFPHFATRSTGGFSSTLFLVAHFSQVTIGISQVSNQ
jgi:hypothetical protein